MDVSSLKMTVTEEKGGDLVNRLSNRSIFYEASWAIDGIERGYEVLHAYYSSHSNRGL